MKKRYVLITILLSSKLIFSQCFLNSEISVGVKLSTTGSQKLDNILSSESFKLKNFFNIDVELYAYDDANKPNAFASNVCKTLGCHGSVALGKTLLLDEIVNADGYNSVCGIMAHEYAHIIQFRLGSTLEGKYSELQADYLAGWYLGKAKNLSVYDLKIFAVSLYKKGDYNFYSSSHHGTPEERSKIMILGYLDNNLTLEEVYNKSFKILNNFESINSMKEVEKKLEEYTNNSPRNRKDSKKIKELESRYLEMQIELKNERFASDPNKLISYGEICKIYYDELEIKNPELLYNGYYSFKKALITNPKHKYKDQAIMFIKYLGFDMYGIGIEQFNAKNNDKAFEAYKNLMDLNNFLGSIGEKLALTDPNTKELAEVKTSDIINNYVVFATNANKKEEALAVLRKEIVTSPSEVKYLQIMQLLQDNPDKTEYKKWLQEAMVKYPNNVDIIIADINFNIAEKNTALAIEKLNKIILLDPKNKQYYLLLGNLYEKQKDMVNAKKTYKSGLEIAPEDYEMNYNCGAVSYNEAVNAYNSSKNVKTKTNNYLTFFAESKKYFEKCKALRPEKSEVDTLIKKINEIK